MSQNMPSNLEKMTFEQTYDELEKTVQKLEDGHLPLEQAITLYQRGMALAKRCSSQLDQAELAIKTLSPSGELVDFDEA